METSPNPRRPPENLDCHTELGWHRAAPSLLGFASSAPGPCWQPWHQPRGVCPGPKTPWAPRGHAALPVLPCSQGTGDALWGDSIPLILSIPPSQEPHPARNSAWHPSTALEKAPGPAQLLPLEQICKESKRVPLFVYFPSQTP